MKTVWKYKLPITPGVSRIEVPAGAIPITFAFQNSYPTIWFVVNKGQPPQTRSFILVGTGQEVPPHTKYIGMDFLDNKQFVFHVFEVLAS